MSLQITIKGVPPSLNSLYRISKYGKMYLTKEGKDFKNRVQDFLMFRFDIKKHYPKPSEQPFQLEITYYLEKLIDIDNLQKILLDSLQRLIYINDKQITKLTVERKIDQNQRI